MPAQIKLAQQSGTTLINLAVAALIIAGLYLGREIFVPLALAVLLSVVLAPFVVWMQSWGIPRTISVLVVVFIGFSIIFSLGGLMVSQASRLAEDLPKYQQTLRDKIESLAALPVVQEPWIARQKSLRISRPNFRIPNRAARGTPVIRCGSRQTNP
jgi:predicted PurR-regulated permease PerM